MGKRKTHEEYVKEVALKNKNIEVVGKYSGANIKITHRCLIDGYEWDVTPHNVLRGRGCPKCSNHIKRTNESYVKEVKAINPNIEVLEKYINSGTPILHKCTIHNIEWNTCPSNILIGHGCKLCANELLSKTKRISMDEYKHKLKQISSTIIVIGDKYINSNTPILHKCLIDGYEWLAKPNNILHGKGCPKCANVIKKSHEQYVNEVATINSDIEVIGQYINVREPILHKCKKHNIQWETPPSSILQGCGCPECGKEKVREKLVKTHDQYINELKDVNPNITVIGTYKNSHTSILHKCLIDGYEWYTTPGNILSGKNGCPQCNESKGERRIRLWLDNHNIIYETQKSFDDCRNIKPLPFDFYLPSKRAAIEFDGEQHYKPIEHFGGVKAFEKRQKHDNIKTEYCKNNGISLLRIPYFKFDNIEEELNNFLFI